VRHIAVGRDRLPDELRELAANAADQRRALVTRRGELRRELARIERRLLTEDSRLRTRIAQALQRAGVAASYGSGPGEGQAASPPGRAPTRSAFVQEWVLATIHRLGPLTRGELLAALRAETGGLVRGSVIQAFYLLIKAGRLVRYDRPGGRAAYGMPPHPAAGGGDR
jgi:hypothetical protein